jgi:hypothetical protein
MTSRDTSEYFMPSVPMPIPSVTVGKPKTCAIAPAFEGHHHAVDEGLDAGVARVHRRMTVRHADDGLFEVAVFESDGAQHCTVG